MLKNIVDSFVKEGCIFFMLFIVLFVSSVIVLMFIDVAKALW